MPRLALLLAVLVAAAPAPAAEAKRVRVFAVSPEFDLTWADVAFTDWGLGESTLDRAGRLYDVRVSAVDGPDRQVDTGGDRHVSAVAPDITRPPGGALVAWQDHAGRGDGDVWIRRAAGGPARRVDDTGGRGWNAWRPALAVSARRAVAAWEDERDGPAQVDAATAPLRRLN